MLEGQVDEFLSSTHYLYSFSKVNRANYNIANERGLNGGVGGKYH